jgi:hypothetical protein
MSVFYRNFKLQTSFENNNGQVTGKQAYLNKFKI